MSMIAEQLTFFASLLWLFALPGAIFMRAFLGRGARATLLECAVGGFGIGVILLDTLLIIANKTFALPLSRSLVLIAPLLIIVPSVLTLYRRTRTKKPLGTPKGLLSQCMRRCRAILATDRYTTIATLLIVLTIAIKAFYLSDTIFPTATDMGHHLYWVNKIAQTHQLQAYEKQKVTLADDGSYAMSAPQPIPDFIIGEHVPLAAVQIVTGSDILSPEPVLFLFLLDILSVLALFVLARRFFAHSAHAHAISIAVLFLMGPLYTISASQAKFISGGVIGNLFGNLFIPLALFFLYRALTQRSPRFLGLAIVTIFGLTYTHHLSTFILAYVIAFAIAIFTLLNFRTLAAHMREWITLLFTPTIIITIVALVLFALSVHIPSYLNPEAITSATGAPSKDTRTGVALPQLIHTIGEARFTFALVGFSAIALLALTLKKLPFTKLRNVRRAMGARIANQSKEPYAYAFLLAWPLATFAMSTVPQYLGVNIISTRIANYTIIPFALIGGYGLWWLITMARTRLSHAFAHMTIVLLLFFATTSGMYDNNQSLKTVPNITEAQESYAAARYGAQHTPSDAWTLKDHNYLIADTWMKLFYLRDYAYPLSRSYFKRYENSARETCTRDMISAPDIDHARQCFSDLNVRFVIVNPQQDAAQFMKLQRFKRIYDSDHISIFAQPLTRQDTAL